MFLRTNTLWLLIPWVISCDSRNLFPKEESASPDEKYRLIVLNTETCPLPKGLDPKRVTIQSYLVRLTGKHAGGVPANYFYASLLTSDGSRYLAGYPGCSPLLSGAPLSPGESAEGFLNFPIPPSKTPKTLVFTPALIGREREADVVRIALGSQTSPSPSSEQRPRP